VKKPSIMVDGFNDIYREVNMRELTSMEISEVCGGADFCVEPLVQNPQTPIGQGINDMHEAYITFLNFYVFPYIYYCF
jgi:hypothetical protein